MNARTAWDDSIPKHFLLSDLQESKQSVHLLIFFALFKFRKLKLFLKSCLAMAGACNSTTEMQIEAESFKRLYEIKEDLHKCIR